MEKKVGVWLDTKNAIILKIYNGEEKMKRINSEVESRVRFYGETKSITRFGNRFITPEKKKNHRRMHQLKHYLKEIISNIKDASAIFIFGPAETKISLKEELKNYKGLAEKVLAVESADNMTENQIAAKVRKFFLDRN